MNEPKEQENKSHSRLRMPDETRIIPRVDDCHIYMQKIMTLGGKFSNMSEERAPRQAKFIFT